MVMDQSFARPLLAPAFDDDYRMAGNTFEKQRTNPKTQKDVKMFQDSPEMVFLQLP